MGNINTGEKIVGRLKRTGLTLSVTPEERDTLRRLADLEGRSIRACVMQIAKDKLAKLEKKA